MRGFFLPFFQDKLHTRVRVLLGQSDRRSVLTGQAHRNRGTGERADDHKQATECAHNRTTLNVIETQTERLCHRNAGLHKSEHKR